MNKKRNEELIKKAEIALHNPNVKILDSASASIKDSFNGQTAAFGVTIAMSGLRPALAIYQKETEGCKRIEILNAIAIMIGGWEGNKPGESMSRELFACNENELRNYKRKIIDCSIALKQVIRTYKLI